ncbi:MAG: hypothetical protein M1837_000762 [Sclerophora amabilis]|nr:MAG: hypothetical protein M1837_000762 [Sclerophora amabilis]
MTSRNDRWHVTRSRSPFLEVDAAKRSLLEGGGEEGSSVNLHEFSCDDAVSEEGSSKGLRSGTSPSRRNGSSPSPFSRSRRTSSSDESDDPSLRGVVQESDDKRPVTWCSLPRKGQLAILTIARLSEPLTQTSLQAYMFYQLKSFDPELSDSTIASQAGVLQGSFTAAQFITAILWGRIADSWGRKKVLLVGLLGTGLSCVGFGFSKSFLYAIIFRTLGGALNGNVGVMRTMIAEIIKEKKFQSRAFLILPMCFNIGSIVGPVLGGLLADPIGSYPKVFGPNSALGGEDGISWMREWPYALPNIVSAVFLFTSAMSVILGLEETLESNSGRSDWGLWIGRYLYRVLCCSSRRTEYSRLATEEIDSASSGRHYAQESTPNSIDIERSRQPSHPNVYDGSQFPKQKKRPKLPIRRIWTSNVLFTLLAHATLAFHVSTFSNLWFVFLSTPRFDPAHPEPNPDYSPKPPFKFTGGLGMPPRQVGFAMAILGVIGITLQLFVYPTISQRLGTVNSCRVFLLCFPIAYALAPFLALVPSSNPASSAPASGFFVWLAISGVLFVQVLARTFALPATIILINNCSPHPSVLGTIHGIGQSVASLSRTVGPILGGWLYGVGLRYGIVGGVWWLLCLVAMFGCLASTWVYEGSGHEIILEGDDEEGEAEGVEQRFARPRRRRANSHSHEKNSLQSSLNRLEREIVSSPSSSCSTSSSPESRPTSAHHL